MSTSYPTIVVQLSTREKVYAFRAGLGEAQGIVALGIDPMTFRTLAGIDALYLSITRTERWRALPPPPHEAALLRTTDADQREGMPKYVVTGLVLHEDDPNTAAFSIPLMLNATQAVIDEVNAESPGAIRTIGFSEYELTFPGGNLTDVARVLAASLVI